MPARLHRARAGRIRPGRPRGIDALPHGQQLRLRLGDRAHLQRRRRWLRVLRRVLLPLRPRAALLDVRPSATAAGLARTATPTRAAWGLPSATPKLATRRTDLVAARRRHRRRCHRRRARLPLTLTLTLTRTSLTRNLNVEEGQSRSADIPPL